MLQHCGEFSTPQLCIAETQTAGRGRHGKSWQSPPNGVTFSLLRRLQRSGAQLGGLSLVTGCAVITALEAFGVRGLHMKWPNDILDAEKKFCGVLIEMSNAGNGCSDTITGIGLNYQGAGGPGMIEHPFTDLAQLLNGDLPGRSVLIGELAATVLEAYTRYEHDGFAAFRAQWATYDAYYGHDIVLSQADGQRIYGVACGVTNDGALTIQTPSGLREYYSGDLSVRLQQ